MYKQLPIALIISSEEIYKDAFGSRSVTSIYQTNITQIV